MYRFYIFVLLLVVQSLQTSTDEEEDTAKKDMASTCICKDNSSSYLQLKANIMQEQIKNKTNLFSKVHHRVTHSDEALWASICLSFLLVLLVVGAVSSRMWEDRPAICYMDSQPIKYEQFNKKSEILIKTMLKSKARGLLKISKVSKQNCGNAGVGSEDLKMTDFLQPQDEVDSKYQSLLYSSSGSSSHDDISSSYSSDEDGIGYTLRINKNTGEWETASVNSRCHLGPSDSSFTKWRGKKEYSRLRVSSSDSYQSQDNVFNSSVARELNRVSSSSDQSEAESSALIKIG